MFEHYNQEYTDLLVRLSKTQVDDVAEWMDSARNFGDRALTDGADWLDLAITNQMYIIVANPMFWETCRIYSRSLAVKQFARSCVAKLSAYLADFDLNYGKTEQALSDAMNDVMMSDDDCQFAVDNMPDKDELIENIEAALATISKFT